MSRSWQASWIGAPWQEEDGKKDADAAPLLRKAFDLPAGVVEARAYVTGVGYYELYVNGRKVGDEVLSPAVSDYGKRGLYLTHDITAHLVKGRNCIGLWLGRGWSTGVLKNAGTSGPMVKAEITVAFDGAEPLSVATGADWKAHPSSITPLGKGMSGSYGGERVEAAEGLAAEAGQRWGELTPEEQLQFYVESRLKENP